MTYLQNLFVPCAKTLFMTPVEFPGSVPIHPLRGIDDNKELLTIWAVRGTDRYGDESIVTAWQPSYEDLKALNNGGYVYINTTGKNVPSMGVFTLDEFGRTNDPGLDEE